MTTYTVKETKEYQKWFVDNKFHRENGPAITWYHKNGNVKSEHYYLDGIKYLKEEFLSRTSNNSCDGKIVNIDGKNYKLTEV